MRRSVSALAVLLSLAAFASACSRGNELGPDEAVEILVLDGIERSRAECIVADLDGRMPLGKVTGIDTDLSAEEVATLAASSAACEPPLVSGGGVVGGVGSVGELDSDGLMPERMTLLTDLVRGGMDEVVAGCLVDATLDAPDPIAALGDDQFRAKALLACESGAG